MEIVSKAQNGRRPGFDDRSKYGHLIVIGSFGRRQEHVGYRLCRGKHPLLCHCDWIRDGVRPARGEGDAEMMETFALGLVTVALLVYLVYALVRPEKF